MANFELDPHRFLPRGHGIIDGGALRLPRTFVTPSHFVPDQFESYCVAVVELEPPAQDLHDLLHLARDFIIGLGFEAAFSGRFTGIRRSWTAPIYVLTSEFADVIPANEDPMPVDGNPHLLPGALVPDNNMFVLPEYPTNGWNDAPPAPQPQHGQPSPVNDMPADSASGVTVAPPFPSVVQDVMMNEQPDDVVPPVAVLQQAELLAQQIQLAVPDDINVLPHQNGFVAPVAPQENFAAVLEENVAVEPATVDVIMEFQPEDGMFLNEQDTISENAERAIALFVPPISQQFQEINHALDFIQATASNSQVEFVQTRKAAAKKTKEKKTKDSPMVDTGLRRRTRGSAAKEGYRVPPITDIAPKPRKKARKAALAVRGDHAQDRNYLLALALRPLLRFQSKCFSTLVSYWRLSLSC
ncbi:hypothetical protein ACQ4PT_052427 [Festuca glaucescens]